MNNVTVGIDYSMTCPAVVTFVGGKDDFKFDECRAYYQSERKPIVWNNITGSKTQESASNEERWDLLAEWTMDAITEAVRRCSALNHCQIEDVVVRCYIEDYSFASNGRSFHLAENAGLVKHKMWKAGYHVVPVSPSVIKKFGSGKGNALKEHMFAAFLQETGHNLMSIFQPKATNIGSPVGDIVDAYYICKFGIMVGGEGNLEPRKKAAK